MPNDNNDRLTKAIDDMANRFAEIWRNNLHLHLEEIRRNGFGSYDHPSPYASPIEELFAAALTYCFHAEAATRNAGTDGDWHPQISGGATLGEIRDALAADGFIRAWAQVSVGAYRTDFLLGEPGYTTTGPILVAVECDGHEFHEKTKVQVARDKHRDNFFQAQNIPILRYSGSTIWRNPIEAAADALTKLEHISTRRYLAAEGIRADHQVSSSARSWRG